MKTKLLTIFLNRAWLFSSGLVLGFSLLQPHEHMSDTRQAFQSTRRILGHFGLVSPQAKQYHCILDSFGKAIETYERKRRSDRSRSKSSAVQKILCFDRSDSEDTRISEIQTDSLRMEDSEVYADRSESDASQIEALSWQWDYPASTGDNEIMRMFLDPCLNSLMSLTPMD